MRKVAIRVIGLLTAASLLMAAAPCFTGAWDQAIPDFETHQAINRKALDRFFAEYSRNAKYQDAPLERAQPYWGLEVKSSTLLEPGHIVRGGAMTFEDWVVHGGFSADEPHLWASVRHFYDPLRVCGVPELTDHNSVHGTVFRYTAISAKYWAFEDPANPFGWKKALEYYKRAMEIPEGTAISEVPGNGDFRDPNLPLLKPTAASARQAYMGEAFRALGETMHMVADMTQPCHVRNDSHPTGDLDPLELAIRSKDVEEAAVKPVDPRIGGEIDSAPDVQAMYENMALYTNRYFYTDDTIYDQPSGVNPRNGEKPYPYPQFTDLTLDQLSSLKTYVGQFNGKPVPMCQQTYLSYKLGPLWTDYVVPSGFAREQAMVLLPIAIKACSRVVDWFFPTLKLDLDMEESGEPGANTASHKEYLVDGSMTHLVDKDPEWSKQGFEIKYSGPGELRCDRKGKPVHIADAVFVDGDLEEPLVVFTGEARPPEKGVEKYRVENEDDLYFVVEAGSRTFTSNKHKIAAPAQVTVTPPRLDGKPAEDYVFTGKVDNPPPGKLRYDWTLNGKKAQSGPESSLKTSFAQEGAYEIRLAVFDEGGALAGAAMALASIKKEAQPQPAPSSGQKYDCVVALFDTRHQSAYNSDIIFYRGGAENGKLSTEGKGSMMGIVGGVITFEAGDYSADVTYYQLPLQKHKATVKFNIPGDLETVGHPSALRLIVPAP